MIRFDLIPGAGKVAICEECPHRWFPRVTSPKKCPSCGILANSHKHGKRGNPNWSKLPSSADLDRVAAEQQIAEATKLAI